MDFDKVVKERKSVRNYKSKGVKFEHLLEAVDAALQGPFAGNHNNLKFIIVEEAKTIKNIAKHCGQAWVNEAPALIIVCSDGTQLEKQYYERGKDYSKQQAGAAIAAILLKLADLKLSSCWVGAFDYEIIKELLKIPAHIHIEAIIPAGYEKGSAKKPRKSELQNVLRWENWNNYRRPALFETGPMHKL
jgi:nitroreductase